MARKPTNPWKSRQQAERRAAAEERQAAYDSLTIEQKIAKLDAGKFRALKERAKLQKQLEQSRKQ